MYILDAYKLTDLEKITRFIEENNFGDLVTFHNGTFTSNKVPFFFDKESNQLYGHFGRNNSQLVDLKESNEVLVILSGPHAYISPQWYDSMDMVPTWNFQTLQIRGKASILDSDGLTLILEKLSTFQEVIFDTQWSMDQIDQKKLELMKEMIVGFKIEIDDIKFKSKMSQNRNLEDRQSVITALKTHGNSNGLKVAKIMSDDIRPENETG